MPAQILELAYRTQIFRTTRVTKEMASSWKECYDKVVGGCNQKISTYSPFRKARFSTEEDGLGTKLGLSRELQRQPIWRYSSSQSEFLPNKLNQFEGQGADLPASKRNMKGAAACTTLQLGPRSDN
jgi:hypothetical protein